MFKEEGLPEMRKKTLDDLWKKEEITDQANAWAENKQESNLLI